MCAEGFVLYKTFVLVGGDLKMIKHLCLERFFFSLRNNEEDIKLEIGVYGVLNHMQLEDPVT